MSDYDNSLDRGPSQAPSPVRDGPVQSQRRAGNQLVQRRATAPPPAKAAPPAVVMRKADGTAAAPLPFTGISADAAAWAFHPHTPAAAPTAPVQAKPAADITGRVSPAAARPARQAQPVQRQEGDEADAAGPTAGDEISAEIRERLMARLAAAPASQETLEAIEAARGDLGFSIKWSARGGYHRSGTIWIDLNDSEDEWFSTLAHETVHLRVFLEGREANVSEQERDDYVSTRMENEIEAHATTYIVLLQAGELTSTETGFQQFLAFLRSDHAEALENEQWAAIKDLAKPWLEQKYRDEWVGSATGRNYYEKWGDHWDANH
ncbi:MAG: hypothetical protein Tsb0020_23370 [Haliangiales bacterium]